MKSFLLTIMVLVIFGCGAEDKRATPFERSLLKANEDLHAELQRWNGDFLDEKERLRDRTVGTDEERLRRIGNRLSAQEQRLELLEKVVSTHSELLNNLEDDLASEVRNISEQLKRITERISELEIAFPEADFERLTLILDTVAQLNSDLEDGRERLKAVELALDLLESSLDDRLVFSTGEELVLTAQKLYRPSRWYNGRFTERQGSEYTVPSQVFVLAGNSGNHTVTLSIGGLRCVYHGGSDLAHVVREDGKINLGQFKKGLHYWLKGCEGGRETFFLEISEEVELSLDNGDSRFPLTSVIARLIKW